MFLSIFSYITGLLSHKFTFLLDINISLIKLDGSKLNISFLVFSSLNLYIFTSISKESFSLILFLIIL